MKRTLTKENPSTVGLDYWSTFGQRLVDLIALTPGTTLLDVGTGPASCLIPAAKKLGPSGKVIGIDNSDKSIPLAKKNIQDAGLTNSSVLFMNAEEMSFEDEFFDFIVCGFIGFGDVYNFQEGKYLKENKVMSEIYRVLKKKGKVGFTTWKLHEDLELLKDMINEYLQSYSSEKKISFELYSKETEEGFQKLLIDAKFQDIQIFTEKFTIIYKNEVEWWETMFQVGNWVLKQSIGLDTKTLEDFKEKVMLRRLEKYKREEGFGFTKSVIFAFGKKG